LRVFVQRSAFIAALVLVLDELVKTAARVNLAPCSGSLASCEKVELLGSPGLLVKPMSRGFRSEADRASVGIEVGVDGRAAEWGE
jgi:hypothetical protein